MVRPRPRAGLLHARRASPLQARRPRGVPRAVAARASPRAARSCCSSTTTRRCARSCASTSRWRATPSAKPANAEDGLAALEDEAPDLILLDVMMPQVDGWEMLRRVQERHGVGSIPVVMFSGQLDARPRGGRARRAGLRRQAVRPARADRPDEADRSGLISADRHLERWVVHHRAGWLNRSSKGSRTPGARAALDRARARPRRALPAWATGGSIADRDCRSNWSAMVKTRSRARALEYAGRDRSSAVRHDASLVRPRGHELRRGDALSSSRSRQASVAGAVRPRSPPHAHGLRGRARPLE